MKDKLIPIIGAGLSLIAVGISVFVLITVMGMSKNINMLIEGVEPVADNQVNAIPISQQNTYEMPSSAIAVFQSPEGDKTMNVSINIVLGVDNEHEDFADIDTLLTGNSAMAVIKDGISGLLATKDMAYMEQLGVQDVLRDEMLELVREEVGSDAVVAIYFPDGILKSVK